MSTRRTTVVALLLTAGAVGMATPALADLVPGIPGLPTPSTPPAPLPTLPPAPLPTSLPSLPGLPALPAVPQAPIPAVPVLPAAPPAAAPPAAAPQAAPQAGGLPFGGYVDDGLGRWLPPLPALPDAHFAPPPDLPYDRTGYDQTDYALPRNWTPAALTTAANAQASSSSGHGNVGTPAWLAVLAAAAVGTAGAGTVVLRRRRADGQVPS